VWPSSLTVQLPANTAIGGTLPRDLDMLPLLRIRHLSHDKTVKGRFNIECPDAYVLGWNGSFLDTDDEDWEPIGPMIAWLKCRVLQDFVQFESAGWTADVPNSKIEHVHFRRWHGNPIIYVLFHNGRAPEYINKHYAKKREVAMYLEESGLDKVQAFFDIDVGVSGPFTIAASIATQQ
jgi:hypothetical protein